MTPTEAVEVVKEYFGYTPTRQDLERAMGTLQANRITDGHIQTDFIRDKWLAYDDKYLSAMATLLRMV